LTNNNHWKNCKQNKNSIFHNKKFKSFQI
jgi:hypothetical protein